MSDFSVRSDNVDVEQIMRQIRARIREKRGVDYTEDEVRELAKVKLETFIDPKGVRSGLLEEHQRLASAEVPPPNFEFGEDTIFETHRAPIRWIRRLLRPVLKLLFNPNPLIQALHIQAELNRRNAEHNARLDALYYEVVHNLVVELTRTGIEVKSLKMRLESMASRLDFDERRARALEGVVQYRPGAVAPLQPPTGQRDERRPHGQAPQGQVSNALDNEGNERRSRRRRRRGRRRGADGRGPVTDVRGGSAEPAPADQSRTAPEARQSYGDDRTSDVGPRTSETPGGTAGSPDAPPPPDRTDS